MGIVIVGAGNIGSYLAERLLHENKIDVVIIEEKEEKVSLLRERLDVKSLCGNGVSPALLTAAGINSANMIIAVTDSDETNLLACHIANLMAPAPITVARVRNGHFYEPENKEIIDKLNIDMMINPEEEAARSIINILTVPQSVEVIDLLEGKMKLVGLRAKEDSPLIGRELKLLEVASNRHMLIASIIRGGEVIIPSGSDKILKGDTIYFVAEAKDIKSVLETFGIVEHEIKDVMICGGSFIGMYLAKALTQKGINVKIVDPDPKVCSMLIREIPSVSVFNDSPTNQDFLIQENVGEMGAFIATTPDDEDNILSALLAKRLGAHWTIALVNNEDYIPLVSTIGVDVAVTPNLIASSKILYFVRKGKVLSISPIHEDAEIIEFEALDTSSIIETPLKNAKLPKGTIILCVERDGQIIVPSGDTTILPRDKVLVATKVELIPKIEKLFTVKLEYF